MLKCAQQTKTKNHIEACTEPREFTIATRTYRRFTGMYPGRGRRDDGLMHDKTTHLYYNPRKTRMVVIAAERSIDHIGQ